MRISTTRWFVPQTPTTARAGTHQGQELELHPRGWQEPNYFSQRLPPPGPLARSRNQSSDLNLGTYTQDAGIPSDT